MPAYAVMMVDPPWPVRKGGKRAVRPRQGRTLDYSTLSVQQCFLLLHAEVFSQLCDPGCVFLWVVDRVLREAEQTMEANSFRRHARFVWDKENGVAPAFTVRFTHEYLIWYYRSRLPPVAQEVRGRWTTVLREAAREHSRKPDVAYRMVEELYPDARRLDVFSREKRDGWEQYGDQCDHF